MSTSVRFLKAEAGKQSAFGTGVTTTFKLPFVGEYEDAQEEHEAEFDAGTWAPQAIVEKVANYATFSLNGAGFFEILPVLLSAGFADLTPTGAGPYTYDADVGPSAPGTPSPYTFLFGGNEAIGGTGPAIKIIDGYMESMTLSGNINSKEVSIDTSWFGRSVDDNSGAGFAFAGSDLPTQVNMMKSLLGAISLKDATTTGGDFTSMTALSCSMLDWSLTINTGLRPKWSTDGNSLNICGVEFVAPSVEFAPQIRTNATNYALVKTKAEARTFQELQLTMTGANSTQWIVQMTGRWLPNFAAHGRANDEVVMTPTFRAGPQYTQTTTPHFFGWQLDTQWSHT